MIPLITQQKLNLIAEQYSKQLQQDVRKIFDKYKRSGALTESIQMTVTKATSTEAPKIIVTYADQGFFIGMKSPQWTKLPNMGNLQKWSEDVSFSGPVPGYKNGVAPNLPAWKIKQRQLWAIAKSKQKFDKWTPKMWKRQAKLPELLRQLNAETIAAYERDITKLLTQAIEN
jgi:hypothetical protein